MVRNNKSLTRRIWGKMPLYLALIVRAPRRKPETGRVSLPTVEQVVTTFLLKAHV